MAKTTLTVELTEDLAREFKEFCKEHFTDVQDGLAMMVMGALQEPDLFEQMCDESALKCSEDMERNPDDYPSYTPEELFAEWRRRDEANCIGTFEHEAVSNG